MKLERPDHLTEEQLHGAAEGSLAGEEARLAQRHIAGCDACRADVGRIRALLATADALPDAIEPPDDLWPAIQARVRGSDARPAVESDPTRSARAATVIPIRRPRREYLWLAAAALLLIIATSAITALIVGDERPIAAVPSTQENDSIEAPARIRAVSDEYDRLDRDLARRLDEQREKLQPETIEKVERNLQIIDRAITEIRQALAEDPNNEALEQLLKASYGQKSALLQQVSQS